MYPGIDVSSYSTVAEEVLVGVKSADKTEAVNQPLFSEILNQSRNYEVVQWSIVSFDMIIGLIGGFIGLVYLILTWFLGGYQEFKFNTALIGEIYSTTE